MDKFVPGLRLMDSFLLSDTYHQLNLQPGKYKALMIRAYSSGNNSGVVDVDTLGSLKITHRGGEIFNSDYSRLYALNELDMKAKVHVVASGSPLNTTFIVPFALVGDNINVLEIESKNENSVEFLNVGTTNIGTGSKIDIFGIQNPVGVANYLLKTFNMTDQVPVSTLSKYELPSVNNICRMLLANHANLDFIQLLKDGDVRYLADDDALDIFTQVFNETETAASQSFLDLKIGDGSIDSFMGHNYHLNVSISTATTALEMLYQTISVNDSVSRERSIAVAQNVINTAIQSLPTNTINKYRQLTTPTAKVKSVLSAVAK